MKNKKRLTAKQMNRQGVFTLIFGFLFWVFIMVKLNVF